MPQLDDALAGMTRIGMDTMSVIYFVEAHPHYLPLMRSIFRRVMSGQVLGVASTITLMEVLVQPLRQGASEMADQYRDLLTNSENFSMVPVSAAVAETAADLRARYNLRTADAIVAATAIQSGCQALVTNDEALLRMTELQVIFLDHFTDHPLR